MAMATGISTHVMVVKLFLILSNMFSSVMKIKDGRLCDNNTLQTEVSRYFSGEFLHTRQKQLEKVALAHTQSHLHVGGFPHHPVKIRKRASCRNAAGKVHVHVQVLKIGRAHA